MPEAHRPRPALVKILTEQRQVCFFWFLWMVFLGGFPVYIFELSFTCVGMLCGVSVTCVGMLCGVSVTCVGIHVTCLQLVLTEILNVICMHI